MKFIQNIKRYCDDFYNISMTCAELSAPARNFETSAAINLGADAIYIAANNYGIRTGMNC